LARPTNPLRISAAGLYDWPPFVIAPGFSAVGVLLMAGLENAIGFQILKQYDLDDIAAEAHASEKEGFMADPTKPLPHKLTDEEGVLPKHLNQ
jgi:hypothetical protein